MPVLLLILNRSSLVTARGIVHYGAIHFFIFFFIFFFNRLLVELLISFPKVLVAAVNGNALGFGTALLSLCDIVYASNKVCHL